MADLSSPSPSLPNTPPRAKVLSLSPLSHNFNAPQKTPCHIRYRYDGTGILFQEPNPIGSRQSDPSGLCGPTHETPPPQHTRQGKEDRDPPEREVATFSQVGQLFPFGFSHLGMSVAYAQAPKTDRSVDAEGSR